MGYIVRLSRKKFPNFQPIKDHVGGVGEGGGERCADRAIAGDEQKVEQYGYEHRDHKIERPPFCQPLIIEQPVEEQVEAGQHNPAREDLERLKIEVDF